MKSAFDDLLPCKCGEWPVLENDGGKVSFVCPRCGARGNSSHQSQGAAYRAALHWNKQVIRSSTND